MKRITIAVFSDVLFIAVCTFCVCFTAIRYFFKDVAVGVAVAALCAVAACLASLYLLLKRREKEISLKRNESEKKLLALYLATLTDEEAKNLFLNALDGTYAVANRIESKNCAYRFCIKPLSITQDDVAFAAKIRTDKDTVLVCCSATDDAAAFADELGVKIMCITEIYTLLKEKSLLPQEYPFALTKEKKGLKRIKSKFNRKRFPSLFFCGVLLLGYSYLSFYPAVYIAFGSLLTTLAAICLFFPPKKD